MSGLAGALAFLAVFVRALFPGGYMLADSVDSGGLAIVICTGEGMKTVVVGQDGKADKHGDTGAPHSAHDGGVCPYAAAAAPGLAPDQPIVFAETAQASIALSRLANAASAPNNRLGTRPPPTGPPQRV